MLCVALLTVARCAWSAGGVCVGVKCRGANPCSSNETHWELTRHWGINFGPLNSFCGIDIGN